MDKVDFTVIAQVSLKVCGGGGNEQVLMFSYSMWLKECSQNSSVFCRSCSFACQVSLLPPYFLPLWFSSFSTLSPFPHLRVQNELQGLSTCVMDTSMLGTSAAYIL